MRLFTVFMCFLAMPAWAEIVVKDAHSFATVPASRSAAVFFTIENKGANSDVLKKAQVPGDIAAKTEIHTNIIEDGIIRMRPVENVQVKAGKNVVFDPSGLHIMLVNMERSLKSDESFPLILTFEKYGEITTNVSVHSRSNKQENNPHQHHHH